MNKPIKIEIGEWWFKGCFIQQQDHPKLSKYIVFYGHPKQNMFAFYPPRTTKKESLEIAYQYYLTMVENAEINEFTYGNVCWTDRGYPLNYRRVG